MSPDSSSEARFCLDCPEWTFQSIGFHRKGDCEAGVSTCNDAGTFNDRTGICDCFELDNGPACDGVLASAELEGSGTDAQDDDEGFDWEESSLESLMGEIIGGAVTGLVLLCTALAVCCKKCCCKEDDRGAGKSNSAVTSAFTNPEYSSEAKRKNDEGGLRLDLAGESTS